MKTISTLPEKIKETSRLHFLLKKTNSDMMCWVPQIVWVEYFQILTHREIKEVDLHNRLYLWDTVEHLNGLEQKDREQEICLLYEKHRREIEVHIDYLHEAIEKVKQKLLSGMLQDLDLNLVSEDTTDSLKDKIRKNLEVFMRREGFMKIFTESKSSDGKVHEAELEHIIVVVVSGLQEDELFLKKLLQNGTSRWGRTINNTKRLLRKHLEK